MTTTTTAPRTSSFRWNRAPRALALFRCASCGHTGLGRVDTTGPLTCSACGAIGREAAATAGAELCAAQKLGA